MSRRWGLLLVLACNAIASEPKFVDITDSSGLQFVHDSGKRGERWTLEITGAGVAVLDFDGDGWLDVWLVQGGPLDRADTQRRETPVADSVGTGEPSPRAGSVERVGDRLFRNLGRGGQLRFEDITRRSGVDAVEYGMGIATGDVDNDGDTDVFLANYGSNQLFENLGDGLFRDVTESSGLSGSDWSISASMADFDQDGLLDIYVGNYLDFKVERQQECRRWSTRPTYCAPSNFDPVADRLYRNIGGRRFVDVSQSSGIAAARGGAMGVVADDFDGDGRTDFFVANDGMNNLLWLNRGDGRFEDGGLLSGVAVNADGIAEASMGIAVADFDRDGDPDIFVTHDIKESNTLYVNDGRGWFDDQTVSAHLAAPSLPYTAFGTGWFDFENDGDLDIINVNGAVAVVESQVAKGIDPPLRQVNQVMVNDGRGRFSLASVGPAFDQEGVSRGAAFGDLDNDGDIDVVVTNNDGPARVYQNVTRQGNWLGLDLRPGAGLGNVFGAVVRLAASPAERKRVGTDGSYASANDPRLIFGLGDNDARQTVYVHWPNGVEESFESMPVNAYHVLRYGSGRGVVVDDGCSKEERSVSEPVDATRRSAMVRFVDASHGARLDFTHVNGMSGEKWLPEILGAGVAVFDFDDDGQLDVWLVQSGHLRGQILGGLSDQLFRNVDADELLFSNITELSGVRATGYGMGIATGDIDNDGDLDVFVSNYGPNQLYRNVGGGRFEDITERSGIGGRDEWSTGASFADVDDDGRLDLFVVNYLDFSVRNHQVCRDLASRPTYCAPHSYKAVTDRLYRNLGDGVFEDVSAKSGIEGSYGGALGVVAADFDDDGTVDFYVANDAVANSLWLNQGRGRFRDHAWMAGVAVNGDGDAEASMGVDAEDFDNDCDVDLFMTHLVAETNTLYENQGSGWFADRSNRRRLAMSSGPFTGFGTGWFDADNDGDLDLFSANGAITEIAEQRRAGVAHPFRQVNQLWLNDGHGMYREIEAGPAFELKASSRGASFGDLDNDGDVDIVVTNNNGEVRLYRNDSDFAHWLGVELEADGTVVTGSNVWLAGAPCTKRRIATDGSYASAHDPRIVFGLGAVDGPQVVRVQWPDGLEEAFGALEIDRYHRLRRGKGVRR